MKNYVRKVKRPPRVFRDEKGPYVRIKGRRVRIDDKSGQIKQKQIVNIVMSDLMQKRKYKVKRRGYRKLMPRAERLPLTPTVAYSTAQFLPGVNLPTTSKIPLPPPRVKARPESEPGLALPIPEESKVKSPLIVAPAPAPVIGAPSPVIGAPGPAPIVEAPAEPVSIIKPVPKKDLEKAKKLSFAARVNALSKDDQEYYTNFVKKRGGFDEIVKFIKRQIPDLKDLERKDMFIHLIDNRPDLLNELRDLFKKPKATQADIDLARLIIAPPEVPAEVVAEEEGPEQLVETTVEEPDPLQTELDILFAEGRNLGDEGDGMYDYEIAHYMQAYKQDGFLGIIAANEIPLLVKNVSEGVPFSFIMNTHERSKPRGGHWVAVNVTDDSLEYYDSLADPPSEMFMRDIKLLIDKFNPEIYLKFKVNRIKHQDDRASSCGWHAMNFLIGRYDGREFRDCSGFSDTRRGEKVAADFKKKMTDKFGYI